VRQLLKNLQATGMQPPENLLRLARELEESFEDER
jgi:hypothetical protein